MVIFRICHDKKSLPVPGTIGLHMAQHSNPKYISLIKKENNHSKKGRYFDIDYVTLYTAMCCTQIN